LFSKIISKQEVPREWKYFFYLWSFFTWLLESFW
jgi:hypothetical protein